VTRGYLYAAAGGMAGLLVLDATSSALNLTLLAIAYAGLVGVVVTERRQPWLDRRTLLWVVGGLLVLAVVVPPVESRDVWAYAMYGRILGVHHLSPYATLPAHFAGDPFLGQMDTQWHHTASVYGPLFTSISGLGGVISGSSLVLARLWYQLLAAASVVGILVLLDRRKVGVAALACIGLNPLIVISVVNSGHNDALVGLAVLAGVLLAIDRRPALAGAAFAATVLIKLILILPFAATGLWLWRRQGLRAALAAAWVFALLVIGSLSLFGGGEALEPLETAQLRQTASSVWYDVRETFIEQKVDDGVDPAMADHEARERVALLAEIAVGLACVAVVLRRWHDTDLALQVGAVLLAFALIGANMLPWYWAWGLPVLALALGSRLTWVALAHGALLQWAMFPVAVGAGGPSPIEQVQVWTRDTALPVLQLVVLVGLLVARPRRSTDDAGEPPEGSRDVALLTAG
jgi:hypothetical protein